MANELEILTTNQAGDGWIDNTPGQVSTGYQAQNTNIQARSLGQDLTYVRVSDDGLGVTIEISGPVDDGGVPFKLSAQTTLTPSAAGTWYIAVTAGTDALSRSLELVQGTPAYDSTEGVLKIAGDRILNWTVTKSPLFVAVSPIAQTGSLGGAFSLASPDGYIRYRDYPYLWFGVVMDSFSSPGPAPTGLTFDGTNLISCDNNSDTIYIHDGISISILSSFSSPNTLPRGLTFDGTNLISCDQGTATIYIHDGISSSILSSFSSPGVAPTGLAFDGTNLISCYRSANTIYIHDGISSSILSSFSSPGAAPDGITFDGANLISCSGTLATIYINRETSSDILYSLPSPSSSPSGLAFDGVNLISCDQASSTIYIHGFKMT